MKRIVPALGLPLILAVGLSQGETQLTTATAVVANEGTSHLLSPPSATPTQAQNPPSRLPNLRVLPPAGAASPYTLLPPNTPLPHVPGDKIPHSYLVFGLRTGPGGMAFTDRNGTVIPVPSDPKIIFGPSLGPPAVPLTLPPSVPLPAPKK